MESLSFIPLSLATVLSSFSTTDVEGPVINTHINPEIVGLWELDFDAAPNFKLMDDLNEEINNSDDSIFNSSEVRNLALADNSSNENDSILNATPNTSENYRELVLAIQESKTQNDEFVKIVTADTISTSKTNNQSSEVDTDAIIETNSTTYSSSSKISSANNSSSNTLSANTSEDFQEDIHSINSNAKGLSQINGCKERYNFQSDNLVVTSSGAEWTYGQYIYEHQPEGLPVLALTTTYDNNKVDCSGNQIDQEGESMFAFVDYQPENNVMRWCIDNQGDKCFLTFRKLLP